MSNIKEEAHQILDKWFGHIISLEGRLVGSGKRMDWNDELKKIHPNILTNKELVQEICKQSTDYLATYHINLIQICSDDIKNDYDTVLEIIKTNGTNLQFLNDEFKNNKEIVLIAVESSNILKYASDELKDDEDVVLAALSYYPKSIEFASNKFRNNKELALKILEKDAYAVSVISDELKKDNDFLLEAWKSMELQYSKSKVFLSALAANFVLNTDLTDNPFFNNMETFAPPEQFLERLEKFFDNFILNKELQTELNNQSCKQEKKVKL